MRPRAGGVGALASLVAAAGTLSSCSGPATSALPAPTTGCRVESGTPPVPMAISHDDGGTTPYVGVCIDGKGPYWFLLDTGASVSVIDSQLAGSLGLPAVGGPSAAVGVGCVVADSRVRVGRWSVGGVYLSPQNLLTADIPGFGASGGPAGVLGGDVLSRFGAVRIDYREAKFTVLAPEGPPATSARILEAAPSLQPPPPLLVRGTPRAEAFLTVLKTPTSSLATASTTLAGHTYQFVVDTGSAVSSASSSVSRTLQPANTGTTIPAPNVGCRGQVGEVESGTWSITSEVALPSTPLATIDLAGSSQNSVSGTIGSDVLSSYESVVVDYRTGILWLGTG